MTRRTHTLLATALCGLGLSTAAWAQAPAAPAAAAAAPAPAAAPAESADALLARVDRAQNDFKDATFEFTLLIKDASGTRESRFRTIQKGEKRLVRFLSPANIKGMGVLVEGPDSMYVMLPEFNNRVRRVGTHQAGQAFMGSDVSNEDMSLTVLSPTYAPKLVGQEGVFTVLDLSVRPGKNVEFPKLKVWIDAKQATIAKIEYQDASGKKLRTQERLDYKQDVGSSHLSPGRMIFTDHRKGNHQTELVLQSSKVNSGLGDDQFTTRALSRD